MDPYPVSRPVPGTRHPVSTGNGSTSPRGTPHQLRLTRYPRYSNQGNARVLPAVESHVLESLRILRQDDDLLFVNKPPGIVVQRGWDPDEPVLFEQAEAWARERGAQAYLLQRLDRGTSGVLFFSLSSAVNRALTRQFERREISKRYLALVHGRIVDPMDLDGPITRIGPISFGVRPEGKAARTLVTPLLTGDRATLVAVTLMSGRTHQIRVHLAHAGHPLIGDWLYGERDDVRPMLHSWSLAMHHPRTRESLDIRASIEADMVTAARNWGVPVPEDEASWLETAHRGDKELP